MAIKNISIDPSWGFYTIGPALAAAGFESKAWKEIRVCHDALTAWKDKFEHMGNLDSFDHLSDGDDPPDVIAHFSKGSTFHLEHTSIEPHHRHWADKLRGDEGGIIPPVSGKYNSKKELLESMNPYPPIFTPVKHEEIAYFDLIMDAMKSKIEKYPPGGVMVLEGSDFAHDREMQKAVSLAFSQIRSLRDSENWIFIFISRSNHVKFYSAISGPAIALEERG